MRINVINLNLAMATKGVSHKELEEIASVSGATISRMKNGSQTPRPKTIGKIAKALNVSVEYLTEGE